MKCICHGWTRFIADPVMLFTVDCLPVVEEQYMKLAGERYPELFCKLGLDNEEYSII